MKTTIGFIGAGNMASCLILGLIKQKWPIKNLLVSCRTPEKHQDLRRLGLKIIANNVVLAETADIIVFATKPQQAEQALSALSGKMENKCLISLAAGLSVDYFQALLGKNIRVVRGMPNTPAKIGEGISGLFADTNSRQEYGSLCEQLFDTLGKWQWIEDEFLMDVVTATSGSGPAYLFLMAESMIKAATELGLNHQTASNLVIQTLYGAASLLKNGHETPTTLRKMVTSKGGTTAAALKSFSDNQFDHIIKQGLQAAYDRSLELGQNINK